MVAPVGAGAGHGGDAVGRHSARPAPEALLPIHSNLRPGQVRNLGPIAGTGARPGVPGIGAVDLGEVVRTPAGDHLAIFGDSFTGSAAFAGTHYPSVAVPVTFSLQGMPLFGAPATGHRGEELLFRAPPQAAGTNTLPSGSIVLADGSTYMLVVGTSHLNPVGGSWLTRVTDTPGLGWDPIPGSWRPWTPNAAPSQTNRHPGTAPASHPTQISGYQGADGAVYIVADAFDRSQPVTLYRADADQVADRSSWRPWTGTDWGNAGELASAAISANSFGELSFRELGGRPVLSGFNSSHGIWQVEVRVSDDPTQIFSDSTPTVVAHNDPGNTPVSVLQPYGGYILPTSTLSNLNLFVSQWITSTNATYCVLQIQVHPLR